MNNLSTNVKRYKAMLRDGRVLFLNNVQYDQICERKEEYNNNSFVKLLGKAGETVYHGELGLFKEFIEIKSTGTSKKYICEYGVKHETYEECECRKQYGNRFTMWDKLKNMGYEFDCANQITEEMRSEFLNTN